MNPSPSLSPPERRAGAPGAPSGSGLLPAALGAAGLAAVMGLLPALGDGVSLAGLALAYVLVLIPTAALLSGLLTLAAGVSTPRVLLIGAVAGLIGVASAYIGGRPEAFADGPAPLPLAFLFLADAFRICAACFLALALARYINSLGAAFLVAAVATAADLFSVLAGPTRALVQEDSPALDFLLVIFPTFGQPLGFALGVADFVFLALFAAAARYLALRPRITLASGCMAVFLAMLLGLLTGTYLPALPFISLSFILANADLAARSLAHTASQRRRRHHP